MTNEIIHIPTQQQMPITITAQHSEFDDLWKAYFNPLAAVESVFKHVEKLPSSRTTRHTAKQYRLCLYDFLEFCGAVIYRNQDDPTTIEGDTFNFDNMRMHTPDQVEDYIIWCIEEGRASSTINKYLAPIRHYIKALRKQSFLGTEGRERYFIFDCKELFENAADVDAPPPESKSSEDAGIRLTKEQVKTYTRAIDRTTLSGKRDAALFHTMLISGLRVSEVARMTPDSIRQGRHTWEIHVIGKRNNTDPVVLDNEGIALINDWIEAYNAELPEDDPRRIQGDVPIWQPLRAGDNVIAIDETRYNKKTDTYEQWFNPMNGMSQDSIRRIIARRTPEALKIEIGQTLKPHDVRRTLAHMLNEYRVQLTIIQRILRHASPNTTVKYIGKKINMQSGILSNYLSDIWQPAA